MKFEEVKSDYLKWEEYIGAEWDNEQLKVIYDDILNKKIFCYENFKIKELIWTKILSYTCYGEQYHK